jgi:hypothetical protein
MAGIETCDDGDMDSGDGCSQVCVYVQVCVFMYVCVYIYIYDSIHARTFSCLHIKLFTTWYLYVCVCALRMQACTTETGSTYVVASLSRGYVGM